MTDIPQFDNCDGECSIKLIEAILTDWRVNDNMKMKGWKNFKKNEVVL